jgi:hypothetical protein
MMPDQTSRSVALDEPSSLLLTPQLGAGAQRRCQCSAGGSQGRLPRGVSACVEFEAGIFPGEKEILPPIEGSRITGLRKGLFCD